LAIVVRMNLNDAFGLKGRHFGVLKVPRKRISTKVEAPEQKEGLNWVPSKTRPKVRIARTTIGYESC
jgi:hypothetical protein